MILVVGHRGNMGRRYSAILDHLGKSWVGVDIEDVWPTPGSVDYIIIATPTSSHFHDLERAINYDCPVLCEKPITLGDDLSWLYKWTGKNLRMVNQYEHLFDSYSIGISEYDYFKTGQDGLYWDCINIIGLSHKKPYLNNRSPVWRCMINGKILSIADMDQAYVSMIKSWLESPRPNLDYIFQAHRKVKDVLDDLSKISGFNRGSGTLDQ